MRIKRFDITIEFLRLFFSTGKFTYEVTRNALPKDAELVRIHVNPEESTPSYISLFFTSSEFPDIPEGTLLPSVKSETIWITKHFGEDNE